MSNYADLLNNQNNSSKQKKKKGSRVKKIFGGIALTGALILGATGWYFKDNIGDFVKGLGKKDINPDDLLAFSETIPLDRDGVISITYPFVDRTLDETNGRYSLPDSYDFVYVGEGEEPTLDIIKNKDMEPGNIINFESTSGYPGGVIGVRSDYASFLNDAGALKNTALGEDNPNNSKLKEENHDVPNVYSLPNGFKLYCEDEAINKQALLAYIAEDGTNVYIIPESVIDKFVVVTENDLIIIGKYNDLKDQIAEVYYQYEDNRLNNGTQTNLGR